jgi:nicotinamide-nucleotide amidase
VNPDSDWKFSTAAVLSTGTEILQGLYADTNARFLAEKLSAAGITVTAVAAAPDNPIELEKTFSHLVGRADLVICTGGLGPTEDDVNRDVFSRVLGVGLVLDDASVEAMRERFRMRGREMLDSNKVQAMLPAGCTVFANNWGTAPGFFVPARLTGKAALVALPGPPSEMIPMFNQFVAPLLLECSGGRSCVLTRTIHTFGRPESLINDQVRDLFRRDPDMIYTVLAKPHGVDIRITAHKSGAQAAESAVAELVEATRQRVGPDIIYGFDDMQLQDAVGLLLLEKQKTVTAAESCTGGLIAKLLTDVSGSSGYLKESWVVYSNDAKTRLLGVRAETLEKHGAVSRGVAIEMAAGALERAGSDYALSVTGIAGPLGGTPEKPVGLTYIGFAERGKPTRVERFLFSGNREQNRLQSALNALDWLRRELLGNAP